MNLAISYTTGRKQADPSADPVLGGLVPERDATALPIASPAKLISSRTGAGSASGRVS